MAEESCTVGPGGKHDWVFTRNKKSFGKTYAVYVCGFCGELKLIPLD